MTSEYMNNLYRDLLSNSPQTVTIPIPSDMGTGQIAQVVTKQGAVVSDWKMNYFSDMNVRGINSEDYIQMLFCLNDGGFLAALLGFLGALGFLFCLFVAVHAEADGA